MSAVIKKKKTRAKPVRPDNKPPGKFPIVGVGASAGGLEALEGLIGSLPPDSGIAVVVVQHLTPKFKSSMDSILRKHTVTPIKTIEDGMQIEPGCIYLNPPGYYAGIVNNTMVLFAHEDKKMPKMSIDFLFKSMGAEQHERAIGIILSGTGTDGTLGFREIKGQGGITLVQDPRQAKYDGMPLSAIQSGQADHVLPVEKMWEIVLAYSKHPYLVPVTHVGSPTPEERKVIQKILHHLRTRTGHDFSGYKETTISRRIVRRLAVHGIDNYTDYLNFMPGQPDEIDALCGDFLIGVTSFFRDKDAFKALNEKVIVPLVSRKMPGDTLRVWVPGCSTGEEAYSIAILISEGMSKLSRPLNVQIFATDIDSEAIEFARAGIYPKNIEGDISGSRLKRFFYEEGDRYKVNKQIREMVVFALHNFIKDPPFSKLDLISCRNVLIYMDVELQNAVHPIFHYALKPDGFLFLGSSEGLGARVNLYVPVDSKWNLFESKGFGTRGIAEHLKVPQDHYVSVGNVERKKGFKELDVRKFAEREILKYHTPASVLVNSRYESLFFHGATDRYVSLPVGEPTLNILKIIRPDLRLHMSKLLNEISGGKRSAASERLDITRGNVTHSVIIRVENLEEKQGDQDLLLIFFEDVTPDAQKDAGAEKVAAGKTADDRTADGQRVAALENELTLTREYLQDLVEKLEVSNEELMSANEEMQSANEELQSTNEEIETSKEELQSTNEELETVNAELQSKVEELSKANDDLNNLLGSTQIGTIFLGLDLSITRFTPPAAELFNLKQLDIGRPLGDITTRLQYDGFIEDIKGVLNTLIVKDSEVRTADDSWFAVRIMPYRTTANVIDGVVVTFVDITKSKKYEEARGKLERFTDLFQNSMVGLIRLEIESGKALEVNNRALELLGYEDRTAFLQDFVVWRSLSDSMKTGNFLKTLERSGTIENMLGTFKRKDGSQIPLGFSARADLSRGIVDMVLVSFLKGVEF